MVEIIVETDSRPTEDVERVKKALTNLIAPDNVEIEETASGFKTLRARCYNVLCLEPLKKAIKAQQIEPAVRGYLLKRISNSELTIMLHKQAAYVGKISLIDAEKESPLGPIRFTIRGDLDELLEVIEYLTGEGDRNL